MYNKKRTNSVLLTIAYGLVEIKLIDKICPEFVLFFFIPLRYFSCTASQQLIFLNRQSCEVKLAYLTTQRETTAALVVKGRKKSWKLNKVQIKDDSSVTFDNFFPLCNGTNQNRAAMFFPVFLFLFTYIHVCDCDDIFSNFLDTSPKYKSSYRYYYVWSDLHI